MRLYLPYLKVYQHWIIIIFGCFFVSLSSAQISPGKLTKAHTDLEGIGNCTQCHELGAKISEQKCLSCHQPLKTRISQNKGFHVSKDVKGKQCISCHSEHHGLNFEMVRFDKKNFNHNLTGYELKGAHKSVDCAQCHQPSHISDVKLKLNSDTYLGLNPSCVSCHDDYHQKTLGNDCAQCHNTEKFKPAVGFDHGKTDFPLTGAHIGLDCALCHKTDIKNGKEFQHFANVNHKNCNACHNDPHHGDFGTDCRSCHSTESFSKMKSTAAFNHSLTGFVLEGKHKTIDCKKCHDNRAGTQQAYSEFAGVKDITCLTCHEDVHESKLGPDCRSCHDQQSFSIKGSLPDFDHVLTGYTLTGKHTTVDCRMCHTQAYMTAPLRHDACAACHRDYHEGDFLHLAQNDCKTCHSTDGFTESSFDFERHNKTAFPLNGAHLATPCIACHRENKDRWRFKDIGNQCVDCHQNIHVGYISEKYLPNNDCRSCHDNQAWSSIHFDHSQTHFKLEGQHDKTSCVSCHLKVKDDFSTQQFIGLNQQCTTCHDNIHGNQFEDNGITDCKKCHGFEAWDRSQFNHDNARFRLEGAHLKAQCHQCHPTETTNGVSKVIYKTGKIECTDCHL